MTIAHDEWVAEARAVTVAAELTRRGIKALHEQNGPCPACGGTDRFAVNLRKNIFICRASGAGGDAIALCEHLDGTTFQASCETLTGRPPPGREQAETDEQRQARRQRLAARADLMAACRRAGIEDAAMKQERDLARCRAIIRTAIPIHGTRAEAYLETRGLTLPAGFGDSLWYHPALEYWGFADGATKRTMLGRFPAMLGVVQDEVGAMVGLHRTWLDPDRPAKLTPPGDRKRNPVRKILGSSAGLILLSPLRSHMVLGEGIESALSGHHLGIGAPDACYASGVSLGNIAGAATDSLPHPGDPTKNVPNGEPDHHRPGLMLPDDVDALTILVDGDSEAVLTRAHMATAGRRFTELERRVFFNEALPDMDHNDMLRQQRRAA